MQTLSPADLAVTGHTLAAPFKLQLGVGVMSCELVCLEVLRWLPGRRLVAKTAWQDPATDAEQDVVLKLFLGPRAAHYRQREKAGLRLLENAGMRVPGLLAEVADSQQQALGLLFPFLRDARVLTPGDTEGMANLVVQFARLHAVGIRHRDPNLNNFLFSGDEIWMVDGDAVSAESGPLSVRHSIYGLSALLAERPPEYDAGLANLGSRYCQARDWPCSAAWLRRLCGSLRQTRSRRIVDYRRKTQRNCSEFVIDKRAGRFSARLRAWQPQAWEVFAADPERVINTAEVIKAGNSATVVRWQTQQGQSLIVKRYNVKSTWHGVRRMLKRRPRYRLAWQNGHVLNLLDIPTARPLALLEATRTPFNTVAYLLLTDLGRCSLADEIDKQGLSVELARQTASLFALLKQAGLRHGDGKASNFLVHDNRVCCVDLDALRTDRRGWRRDVRRFLDSWEGDTRRGFELAFADEGLLF